MDSVLYGCSTPSGRSVWREPPGCTSAASVVQTAANALLLVSCLQCPVSCCCPQPPPFSQCSCVVRLSYANTCADVGPPLPLMLMLDPPYLQTKHHHSAGTKHRRQSCTAKCKRSRRRRRPRSTHDLRTALPSSTRTGSLPVNPQSPITAHRCAVRCGLVARLTRGCHSLVHALTAASHGCKDLGLRARLNGVCLRRQAFWTALLSDVRTARCVRTTGSATPILAAYTYQTDMGSTINTCTRSIRFYLLLDFGLGVYFRSTTVSRTGCI